MTQRNSSIRDRHRAALRRAGDMTCHICGEPIDPALKYPDPRSFVADHIIPLAHGGGDVLENKAPAHAECNWKKAAKTHAPIIRRSGALKRPDL